MEELLKLLGHGGGEASYGASERYLTSVLQFEGRDSTVDTALGMLGFTSSSLCHSMNGLLLDTLTSLLLSTISCGHQTPPSCSLHHDPQSCSHQKALIGSSVTDSIMFKALESCRAWLRMENADALSAVKLLEVLLKVASLKCTVESDSSGSFVFFKKRGQKALHDSNSEPSLIKQLLDLTLDRRESLYNQFSPPARLLVWHLEPLLLEQDISALVHNIVERPLLSIRTELQRRVEWRNLVIGLALGPDAYREMRRVLNTWFLSTGSTFVLEVRAELVAAVGDILVSPCSWELPAEIGYQLPPLLSLYSCELQRVLQVLSEPLSMTGLSKLVKILEDSVASTEDALTARTVYQFSNDSVWALMMDFPNWLLFASLLLFLQFSSFPEDILDKNGNILNIAEMAAPRTSEWQENGARYISWLVSPYDGKHRESVVCILKKVAGSWLHINTSSSITQPGCTGKGKKYRRLSVEQLRKKTHILESYSDVEVGKECLSVPSPDQHSILKEAVECWLVTFCTDCSQLKRLCCPHNDSIQFGNTDSINMKVQGQGLDSSQDGADLTNKKVQSQGCQINQDGGDMMESAKFSRETSGIACDGAWSLLDNLPLVALAASSDMMSYDIASSIFNFIIFNRNGRCDMKHGIRNLVGCSIDKKPNEAVSINDLHIREPAHRTEDFREWNSDASQSDSLALYVTGVSFIFRFLDDINSIDCIVGLGGLSSFKEVVAEILVEYLHRWTKFADYHVLSLLSDLHQRALLWFAHAGLEAKARINFEESLQSLDVLIASMLASA